MSFALFSKYYVNFIYCLPMYDHWFPVYYRQFPYFIKVLTNELDVIIMTTCYCNNILIKYHLWL
jgi:hypothetical protein